MRIRHTSISNPGRSKQCGAALMVMLVIMVLGALTLLVSSLNKPGMQLERDSKTTAALAQAKEALIGFAVKVQVSSSDVACAATSNCRRPGDLPCPDMDNDGDAESNCGDASGSNQYKRLGRLPWKTLGLPDLRDGSGERLWYAVSNNFKNNTRTTCSNSNLTGCLNSDTEGTINIRSSDGSVLNTGNSTTGAVAVIIAPGEVLQRQGSSSMQDRSSTGINIPINYLDIATVAGNTEDNANFVDSSATDGFIQGRIIDNTGRTVVNDRLLVITEYHIIPLLEKRVAAEVKNCLIEYAALPQNQGPSPNQGYYPWATARTAGPPVVYKDQTPLEFGHIPDTPFEQTCEDTGGSNCDGAQSGGMKNSWGTACTLNNSNWWVNWKEMVFYGFANRLRPHDLTHTHACSDTPNPCLVVNPPSSTIDKHFVVIVAGEKLPGQVRNSNTDKSNRNNYLEGGNANGTTPFQKSPLSTTFNDTVLFQ